MNTLKNYLQHRFNPLHLFCRLCDAGLDRSMAMKMCGAYERFLYKKVSV